MPSDAAATEAPRLRDVLSAIADELAHPGFGTGPLAELRRFDPATPATAPAALHRLLARFVPEDWLHGASLTRWMLVIHCLALAASSGGPRGQSLGWTLAEADFKEARLTRLLKARPDELAVLLPRTVRFLAAAGRSVAPHQLASLILVTDPEKAAATRLRLARDYYGAEPAAARNATA
jgi:CRISPR type I-E-associated protein CasB/Cse2